MINALPKRAGLVLTLLATFAQAGPLPSYDISLLEVGTVIEWQTDRGLQSMTYLGPDDGLLKIHLSFPTTRGHTLEIDGWQTQSGQTKRAVAGNQTMVMSPHDCSNSVGHCEYFIIYGILDNVKIEYFGTYFDDGILMETRSASDPEFTGFAKKLCSIYDQFGISIVTYAIGSDGNSTWERRINSDYEPDIESMMLRVEARCTEDIAMS
ncbi:MAG: hypothetical protein GQ535_02410 [Rhodobacteraceae bacterium]|nr:hypothetical protein [Paracoccaceae bacterium]